MSLIEEFQRVIRVKKIFERYCREGKRPTRQEAEDWLISEGWQEYGRKNLLLEWGYTEEEKS